MKNKLQFSDKSLRQKAEELLKEKGSKNNSPLSEADSLKLMYELEVHQIELDMQNHELQQSKVQDAKKLKLFHVLELHQMELEMQKDELERAQLATEEIANKYSTLYDFAPTGYFTLSCEGDILGLNLCGAQMLGKDRAKLIHSKFGFFVSNNTKPFFRLFLDKIFITNQKETCEISISIDNCAPVYAHLTGIAENESQCLVTLIDISKRKQAEEELILKNVIFDTSIAANSIFTLDGIITEVNNSFYLMHGYKDKYEVLNKPITHFTYYKHQGDGIISSLKNSAQWEGEFIAQCANGLTFIAQGTATVVRDKFGEIVGYQSSVIDISAQKKVEEALQISEQKFRSIFENTQDVFFQLDLAGKIIDVSPSVKRLTNESRNKIIGLSILDSHRNPTKIKSFFDSIVKNNQITDYEIDIKTSLGKSKYVSINAKLINDSQGNPSHIDGSLRDITDRKVAEIALKESQLLLKSSIESAKDMIIFTIDRNYNYLIFNTFFKVVMKRLYNIDISIGMNLLESIPNEEDRIKSKCNFDVAFTGKEQISIEDYGNHERFIFESRYNPVVNENGMVVGATLFAVDVTERINIDRQLKESEYKYRELVENSPDSIIIYIDSKIVFANKQSYQLIGAVNQNELIGKSVLEFVHPSSRSMVVKRMRELVSSSKSLPSTHEKFLRKDGSDVDVEVKATAIKIEGKDAVQLIIRDITRRKMAEEILRQSEERFRKLLQDVDCISVQGYAPDGTTRYWNKASELLYGYTAEEAIGKKITDLIIPDHIRPIVEGAIAQMAQTGVAIPATEITLKRKDGKLISVYSYHTIVQIPGRPQELFCIDIDLTERKNAEQALKESEENYRFMFANNPQPMFIYDLKTLLLLEVNDSAIKHYGYERDEFLSMTTKQLKPHDDVPALMKELELDASNDKNLTQSRHVKKNGQIITVEVTAHTIRYLGEKARHVLINDITERKRMEIELIKRQEELLTFATNLQNVREEERMFLAKEIHDDLAQTLIAIKINMGIMKKKMSKNVDTITVDGFVDNFNQIFSLVDSTINTSRKIMSGLRSEVLEMLGLVETMKLYSKEFEQRHKIKCVLSLNEEEVDFEPLKSIALFRIYQEVLTNVVQHAQATRVSVFMGVIAHNFVFEITDNGIGFDINTIQNIEKQGFISIKERVYVLDGKLIVKAPTHAGTTIRVEIPLSSM